MAQPKDPIQDELEYPEQSALLQQHYAPSLADYQSLQLMRARLLSQHLQQPASGTDLAQSPVSGQFFIPPTPSSAVRSRKLLWPWNFVVLACLLCAVILASTWYTLLHKPPLHGPHKTTVPQPAIGNLPVYLTKLQMTSPLVGWGLTEGVGEAPKNTIVRTTDGGRTWHVCYTTTQMFALLGPSFLNDQDAWVSLNSSSAPISGNIVIHTTDGGAHWTTLQMPPYIFNYTFFDQQHGWAWTEEGLTPLVSIYKTDDGGKSWSKITTPDAARAPSTEAEGKLPSFSGLDMAFVTPQHGWLIVYNTHYDQGIEYPYAALYTTYDGGKNWQTQSLPQPASGPIPGISAPLVGATTANNQTGGAISIARPHFFTSQQGIISVTSQTNINEPSKIYLYTTNDSGQHWSLAGTNITIAGYPGDIAPLYENHIFIASHNASGGDDTFATYIFMQGQWQKINMLHLGGQQVSSYFLNFADSNHGWLSTGQSSGKNVLLTLYLTNDGGNSWAAVARGTYSISPQKQGG